MHDAAFNYAKAHIEQWGPYEDVIEFGSLDINGSVRSLFDASVHYVGVDIQEGPGVDVVSDVCLLPWHYDISFDLVICMEVLEHAPNTGFIIDKAWDVLRPGGHLIITAATDPRAPHSAIDENPIREWEYYKNVDPSLLEVCLIVFDEYEIDVSVPADIRAWAKK